MKSSAALPRRRVDGRHCILNYRYTSCGMDGYHIPLKASFRLTIVENYAQNLFPDLVLEGVVGLGGDWDEDVVVEGLDGGETRTTSWMSSSQR